MCIDKKEEQGPFDIIGDIHGCYDELCDLLKCLDYRVDKEHHRDHCEKKSTMQKFSLSKYSMHLEFLSRTFYNVFVFHE